MSALVFLSDFHTPFFTQYRLGKNKKVFKIIKFRSMLNGEVTKLGRFMRSTGIDELPQLLNIILMQMSFVGPRPLTKEDVERLQWTSTYYEQRWVIKPGIVGLAQLSPVCNKKISWFLDKTYIKKQSLYLDIQILLAAILIPFVGKKRIIKWLHKR